MLFLALFNFYSIYKVLKGWATVILMPALANSTAWFLSAAICWCTCVSTVMLSCLFLFSTLSKCCHAMVALLYPFTWQHTYIPVLPPSMMDIVCTPTPFIVGLLSSSLTRLRELPLEEVRHHQCIQYCTISAACQYEFIIINKYVCIYI